MYDRLQEKIVDILSTQPDHDFMWLHRRLIKDGVRKWVPEYSFGHLLGALHRLDTDGFIYAKDGLWRVNG